MYFQAQLTLNLLSYILLFVVLAVLFDAKSTKNFGTRKKSSQAPFAHATMASIRPAVVCCVLDSAGGFRELPVQEN